MGLFGEECFYRFNLVSTEHFSNTKFSISNDYKKNVVRIWEKINEYERESSKAVYISILKFLSIPIPLLNVLWLSAIGFVIFTSWTDEYFKYYFINNKVIILFLTYFTGHITLLFILNNFEKGRLATGFRGVRDLVRGTIVADISSIWEAYQHFKSLHGIRIVEIKSLSKIS